MHNAASQRMRQRILCALLCACACAFTASAWAKDAAPAAADPALEARMLKITAELRCLVCQNQTIADSHADLAVDLREQVRTMLHEGKSEQQIYDYMTDRYGDFVLYRPPVRGSTWLLWFGPGVALVGGLVALGLVLRRRAKLGDDQFEPDPAEGENGEAGDAATAIPGEPRLHTPSDQGTRP